MIWKEAACLLFVCSLACQAKTMMMTGGLGETRPASSEVQSYVDSVKNSFENEVDHQYTTFKADSFKSQIVAGTNYYVKVDVGGGNYVHLRIYVPLPYMNIAPELAAFQTGKTESDPIEYIRQA